MKKFLISIACFIVLMCVIDRLYGAFCDYLNTHPKRGETFYRNYIINEADDDVIMMGSSRMVHHYVSNIIADSLGVTVWNAGVDGMGIIMNYGYVKLLLRHHTPRVIIYDISPYDFCVEDNVKQLKNLRPYVNDSDIKELFEQVESLERIKLYSNLVKYNSSLLPLIRDYYKPGGKGDYNGYAPLYGEMSDNMACENDDITERDYIIDDFKINLFDELIAICQEKGIQLINVVSPEFCNESTAMANRIGSILDGRAIVFDYSYTEGISNNNSLFQDREHLNNDGAVLFTQVLSERLLSIIDL